MAKKRTSIRRRRPAAGYVSGPKRIRRRKLNGARRTTRRRSMNAARGFEGVATTALKVAVGALAGGVVIGMAEKLVDNFYVRAGGTAVLGLVIAKSMPKLREVGVGVAVAGVVGMGHRALSSSGILPTTTTPLNGGKRRLSPAEMQTLTAKLRAAGKLNSSNGTLNATPDGRAIITGAHQMFG